MLGETGLDEAERLDGPAAGLHDGVENGVDLFRGREVALVVPRLALEGGEVGEAAYADHEELVQVGLEDRDELQALEERDGLVERFVEHALVKSYPGELAVLGEAEIVSRRAFRALRLVVSLRCHAVPVLPDSFTVPAACPGASHSHQIYACRRAGSSVPEDS